MPALGFAAQREHGFEAGVIERGVARKAARRIGGEPVHLGGDLGRHVEALGIERFGGARFSGASDQRSPSMRGLQVGDERRGIRLGPAAQHVRHGPEIRPDGVDHRAHVAEPGVAGVDRERRIENGGGHAVVAHRGEAAERRADFGDRVVGAFEPVQPQHAVEHERPAGVGDVGRERLAAQVGERAHVRLHEQMIEAVVAARDDHGVGAAVLDQCHRLVGGAVHDLVAPGGEPLPLLGGVRRGMEIDREPALGEQARACAAKSGSVCVPGNTMTASRTGAATLSLTATSPPAASRTGSIRRCRRCAARTPCRGRTAG